MLLMLQIIVKLLSGVPQLNEATSSVQLQLPTKSE